MLIYSFIILEKPFFDYIRCALVLQQYMTSELVSLSWRGSRGAEEGAGVGAVIRFYLQQTLISEYYKAKVNQCVLANRIENNHYIGLNTRESCNNPGVYAVLNLACMYFMNC